MRPFVCFVRLQLLMCPFYEFDNPIASPAFDERVRALAKKFL